MFIHFPLPMLVSQSVKKIEERHGKACRTIVRWSLVRCGRAGDAD